MMILAKELVFGCDDTLRHIFSYIIEDYWLTIVSTNKSFRRVGDSMGANRTSFVDNYCTTLHLTQWSISKGLSIRSTAGASARIGNLEVLRWAFSNHSFDRNNSLCIYAATNGHLEVLKWLRSLDSPWPWNKITSACAASNGQLKVLTWMRRQISPCPWSEGTCSSAAHNGHLQMLQWLRIEGCPWNEYSCQCAARSGHFEVLKWLRIQNPPCPWDEYACQFATQNGDLPMLQWLRSQCPPCPWNIQNCSLLAADCGHLEILEWLRSSLGDVHV
jgi:hypothetical protein